MPVGVPVVARLDTRRPVEAVVDPSPLAALAALDGASVAKPPPPAYESPRLSQSVPSSRSTRRTSRNTATMLATYASGVGSRPSCASMRMAPHRHSRGNGSRRSLPGRVDPVARTRDAAATSPPSTSRPVVASPSRAAGDDGMDGLGRQLAQHVAAVAAVERQVVVMPEGCHRSRARCRLSSSSHACPSSEQMKSTSSSFRAISRCRSR